MSSSQSQGRKVHFHLLDFLKIASASLIILHHLAFYGPMADYLRPLLPGLLSWLADDARMAVQVFLVIGGFLAARSLAPQGVASSTNPLPSIFARYVKLAPPFFLATLLAVVATEIARGWMTHEALSPLPHWQQLAAHAWLLHGVLGFESLWAGAWYVAIDFQLFALFACLLAFARAMERGSHRALLAAFLVSGLAAASLFVFNVDASWDNWGIYFFGSYAMGILAWWAVAPQRSPIARAALTGAILLLGGLTLEWTFRGRIAVALGVALLLVIVYRRRFSLPIQWRRGSAMLSWLGQRSYSIFLVHFAVCMLVNAWFTHYMPANIWAQGAGVLLAWIASVAAGAPFHRWIEVPVARLFQPARPVVTEGSVTA